MLLLPSDPWNVEISKQRIVLNARNHGVRPAEMKLGITQKNIQWYLKNFSYSDFKLVSIAKQWPKKHWIVRGRQYGPIVCFGSNTRLHVRPNSSFLFEYMYRRCSNWSALDYHVIFPVLIGSTFLHWNCFLWVPILKILRFSGCRMRFYTTCMLKDAPFTSPTPTPPCPTDNDFFCIVWLR